MKARCLGHFVTNVDHPHAPRLISIGLFALCAEESARMLAVGSTNWMLGRPTQPLILIPNLSNWKALRETSKSRS